MYREIAKGKADMKEFYLGQDAKQWLDEQDEKKKKPSKSNQKLKPGERYPNREPGRFKAEDVIVGPEIDNRNYENPRVC